VRALSRAAADKCPVNLCSFAGERSGDFPWRWLIAAGLAFSFLASSTGLGRAEPPGKGPLLVREFRDSVDCVAWSPDGATLATGGGNGVGRANSPSGARSPGNNSRW
jgi:hypothetical protein